MTDPRSSENTKQEQCKKKKPKQNYNKNPHSTEEQRQEPYLTVLQKLCKQEQSGVKYLKY